MAEGTAGLPADAISAAVPVIADERDHMQAALHLMRDAFVDACQSGVPWERAGELQGQFFDGYAAAKRIWGTALVKRDVLGKEQEPLAAAGPVIAAEAARQERQAIAANLEAEAEIGSWHFEGKDALRSFARRLRELV